MKIYCPFCEEDITTNIKLKRDIYKTLLLTAQYCDEEESAYLDLENILDEDEVDVYYCGECDGDITNFILIENNLLY